MTSSVRFTKLLSTSQLNSFDTVKHLKTKGGLKKSRYIILTDCKVRSKIKQSEESLQNDTDKHHHFSESDADKKVEAPRYFSTHSLESKPESVNTN